MRILICHNFYRNCGGEAQAVLKEKELLENKGHKTILFTRESKEIDSYNFFQKLSLFFNSIFSFSVYRKIKEIIEKEKPDIAHIHNVFPLLSPSIYYALKNMKVPIVQAVHNYRFLCPNGLFLTNKGQICERCKKGNFFNAIVKKCYRNSYLQTMVMALTLYLHRKFKTFEKKIKVFITPSSFLKRKLIEGGIPKEKIIVEPHFVKSDEMKPNYEVGNYVVYMGRLSREKGLFTLLQAWKKVPAVSLKIIGKGPVQNELENFITQEGISNVEFSGFISGQKRFGILRRAICMVVPSECYENMPYAILESFAFGVPVIASRIGGLAEMVKNEKNGLLFNPGDSDDLVKKINYICENPDKALTMRKYAYKCVEANYSAEKHYNQLKAIYRKSIEQNKIGSPDNKDVIKILGVRINFEHYNSAIEKTKEYIGGQHPAAYITLMSANNLVNAQKDRLFKEVSNKSYLSLPDGIPLVWIARNKGAKNIKTNTRGTEFMRKFFERTSQEGYKHFFYGGKEGVAEQLKIVFKNRFPEAKIVGTYCPPFGKLTTEEDREICNIINSSRADIVWVGLSTPKQEYWMYKHKNKLNTSLMIGVGAAFDFLTGNAKEAPRWMQGNGLEWIFRLFSEPGRLWKRYLIGIPLLTYWVVKERFNKKGM